MNRDSDQLSSAKGLNRAGRFTEALAALDGVRSISGRGAEAEVLRAELLERVGRYPESEALAKRLLQLRTLSPSERSACEFVLGLIGWDAGRTTESMARFRRAIEMAEQAGDASRRCWAQLRLMIVLASQGGGAAIASLVADVRQTSVRLGDPHITAALHTFIGEVEAKQSRLESAEHHTKLALRLIVAEPNRWIQALGHNTLAAVAMIRSDWDAALIHAEQVYRLASEAGLAAMRRAALGNLGNVYTIRGDFKKAASYFEDAAATLPSAGEYSNGSLDGLAYALILQGDLAKAGEYLDEIERTIQRPDDRLLYANRHSVLTRSDWFAKRSQPQEALNSAVLAEQLAYATGDAFLLSQSLTRQVEILARLGQFHSCLDALFRLAQSLETSSADMISRYERALGVASTHFKSNPESFIERSKWILSSTGNIADLAELEPITVASHGSFERARSERSFDIARILLHADRVDLLASAVVEALRLCGCDYAAVVHVADDNASRQTLAEHGVSVTPLAQLWTGMLLGKTIEVYIAVDETQCSIGSLAGIAIVLNTVKEVQDLRSERNTSSTIWPRSGFESTDEDVVICGRLEEALQVVRKVARTNISVLITGESGTGKEMIARAVHWHSDRRNRPFIPFNCTAIPSDLVESHLFGYRRGSFTGADRDAPGVIRSAKNGTLFLDEIGDLAIELQPKLLRFLESGEIHPLGESVPTRVDVRVVAATNANLEELVRVGRFREDLYYRLNVIEINLPPLRERRDEIPGLANHFLSRCANEFGKENIRLSDEALEQMLLYDWPGNIRQLGNEIRRIVALAEPNALIPVGDLSPNIAKASVNSVKKVDASEVTLSLQSKLPATIETIERELIRSALKNYNGRVEDAARALGISRKGLYLKRQRLGL